MTYVPKPKDGANVQFGLVSDTGGEAVPTTPIAAADGDGVPPLVDEFGRPWVRVVNGGNGPFMTRTQLPVLSTSAGAFGRQLITGAGEVTSLAVWLQGMESIFFEGASGVYLQIHDAVGVPANGALALYSFPLRSNLQVGNLSSGLIVSTGAILVASQGTAVFIFNQIAFNAARAFVSQGVVMT